MQNETLAQTYELTADDEMLAAEVATRTVRERNAALSEWLCNQSLYDDQATADAQRWAALIARVTEILGPNRASTPRRQRPRVRHPYKDS